MSAPHRQRDEARLVAAIRELEETIRTEYPTTTFTVTRGDDPEGIDLLATVDIDDPDLVTDLVIDRMLMLQVEEHLPIYVVPLRTEARRAALAHRSHAATVPHAAILP